MVQFYTKGKEKRCEDGDFQGEAKGAALGDNSGHCGSLGKPLLPSLCLVVSEQILLGSYKI